MGEKRKKQNQPEILGAFHRHYNIHIHPCLLGSDDSQKRDHFLLLLSTVSA